MGELAPNPYDDFVPKQVSATGEGNAPNPYAGIVAQQMANTANTAKANIFQVQGTNPDEYAKAKAIGDQVGLHPDTVMPDMQTWEQKQAIQQKQAQLEHDTVLQSFMSNRINAGVAQDDLENMSLIGRLYETFRAGYNRADLQSQLTDIYTREALGKSQPEDAANSEALRQQVQDVPQYSGSLGWTGRQLGGLFPTIQTANKAGLIGAAAGTVVPGVGTALGYSTAFGWTFTEEFARQTYADLYHNLGQIKDANGNPISEPLRQFGAITGGVITAVAAELGQGWVKESLATGASKLFTDAFTTMVTRPTVAKALGNFTAEMATSGLEGAAFNSMMTLASTVGEQSARLLTPNISTIFTDPGQWAQFKESLISSVEDGLLLFPMLHLPGAMMGLAGDTLRARQANMDVQALSNLSAGISVSKVRERALDVFVDFLREHSHESPVENFQIPATALMELYQQNGIDPFKLPLDKDPLLGWLPDRDRQLKEAMVSKGDVIIPSADFLGRLAGTPAFETLLPDIRIRPDAFTMREANDPIIQQQRFQHMVNLAVEFKTAYEQDLASHEPTQQVFNDVYRQLLDVDMSPGEASQHALLLSNHYATRAERNPAAYADAMAAYQKSGLKIQAREEPGGLKQYGGERAKGFAGAEGKFSSPYDDVAARAMLTPEQRAKLPPYSSEDIPPDQAILLQRDTKPIPLDSIKEYDDLTREASRRAWEAVKQTHEKEIKNFEKMAAANAEQIHNDLPSTQVLKRARESKIKLSSFKDWDQDTVTEFTRKYPGIVSKKGKLGLDELASEYGYEGDDYLVQDLMNAKSKAQFIADHIEDSKQYMTGGGLGLSADEWGRLQREKEDEVFKELTRSAPTSKLEAIKAKMGKQGPRASLALPSEGYGTGQHLLSLFASRDKSSFLHEGSHLFLEELIHDASLPEASEQTKADLQTVKDWFASHADIANGQILEAKRQAEADLAAHPEDPQIQARTDALRKADALLASDPEYMQHFAQTLGADIPDQAVRMALLTPFHELFARHGEAYFMEGKAPAPGLQSVFDSFKSWLSRIYEKVAGKGRQLLGLSQTAGLPIEVSPEVRGVMDRIIATDEQIALVRQQQRLGRLFKTAEESGMTTAEFKAYNDLVAKAQTEARAQVQAKAMKQLEKQKSDEWRAEDERIRPGVEEQINSRPDLQVLHYLRTKKLLGAEDTGEPGGKVLLSKDALVRLVGEKALKDLPYGIYRKEGGADPQMIAEMFGYRSGTELARALLDIEAKRRAIRSKGINTDIRQYLIDEAVKAKLGEHFGDMMTDGSMPQEVMNAVHSDVSAQALAMELRALIRTSTKEHPRFGPAYDAIGWAKGVIGERKVADVLNLNRYARDEAKAAQAAELAMQKGDIAAAIQAKQTQIANHALYNEARKAQEVTEKVLGLAKRFGKKQIIASMDQDALDQVHTLLERFGLKSIGPNAEGRLTLSDWVRQQEGMFVDLEIPATLYDPNLPGLYKDLTVNQMRDLVTAVQSIVHVGREAKKITVAGKKADFKATVEELAVGAFRNMDITDIPRERNPNRVQGDFMQRTKTKWTNAKGTLRGLDSSLMKLEQIMDDLDGKNSNGPWNTVVFRRAAEREAYENKWRKIMADGVRDLQKAYPKEEQGKLSQYLPDIPELMDGTTGEPSRMTKGELLSIALNWGNDSNRAKMLKGENWSQENVQRVFDKYLEKHDWDFVQGTWDLLEKMRPEIAERQKRMTGVEPVWVDAVPLTTKFGEYRGGYYPMAYDPLRSGDAADRLVAAAEKLLDNSRAGRPTTDKGYTVKRVENYARPVHLDFRTVLPGHIETVIKDLAWREYVYDMVRLFKDPTIRDTLERTVGREQYGQLIPWLKALCNDRTYDTSGNTFWNNTFHWMRINATIVGLGYRAPTMLVHGATAASNSIGEIGVKWLGVGAKKFFGTPEKMAEARDFVFERSSEMRNRMDNTDRDIRDGLRELLDKDGVVAGAKRYAYYGISMLDMASAMPTWIGAYEKAIHEGMTEPDAIYAADKSVRNAHGGGGAKDMAAVQNGTEAQKLFTMFYSFWNHFYNRQRDLYKTGKSTVGDMMDGQVKQGAKDFAAVLARSWWYFVMPQIIHGMIKTGGPGEDESIFGWAAEEIATGLFSGIPGLRDIAPIAVDFLSGKGFRAYQPTPAASAIVSAGKTGSDIAKGLGLVEGEPSGKWLRHSLETAGYVFGLPTGQAATTLQYVWEVMDGEQNPEDTAQFMRELIFGSKKQQKH